MNPTDILKQIWHVLLVLMGKLPKEEVVKPVVLPEKVAKVIEAEKKAVTEEVTDAQKNLVKAGIISEPLTKEQRVRKILDMIVSSELEEMPIGNRSMVINIISSEYQPYILTIGASFAGQKTMEKIQRLNADSRFGFPYAEFYTYTSLSEQWTKQFKYLIEQRGQTVAADKGSIVRANIQELWRQTVWMDKDAAAKWLTDRRITESEITEFLLCLADDSISFIPSTDMPPAIWRNGGMKG
jgi:hypothetical protein